MIPNQVATPHLLLSKLFLRSNEDTLDIGNLLMFPSVWSQLLDAHLKFNVGEDSGIILNENLHTLKLNFHTGQYVGSSPGPIIIDNRYLNIQEIDKIFEFIKKFNISHLDLSDANINDEIGHKLLNFVKTNPNIRKVTLTGNSLLSQELYEDIMANVNSVENMVATFNIMTHTRAVQLDQLKAELATKLKSNYTAKDLKREYFRTPTIADDMEILRKNMCYLPSEIQTQILSLTSPFTPIQEEIQKAETYISKKIN